MTSVLHRFSQIPVRTKYLLGITDGSGGFVNNPIGEIFGEGGASVISVTNGNYLKLGAVTSIKEITDALATAGVTPVVQFTGPSLIGKLFKDLGRQVTVYDDGVVSGVVGSPHIATYRECQLVDGAGTEGVVVNDAGYGAYYYVRVWAASGRNVAVARTG